MPSLPDGPYERTADGLWTSATVSDRSPSNTWSLVTQYLLFPGGSIPQAPPNDWRAAPLFDPGPGRVVWGMYSSTDTLSTLESLWGKNINLTRIYTGTSGLLTGLAGAQNALNAGRVPAISVNWKAEMKTYVTANPTNIGGTGLTWAAFMAAGHFDGDPTTGLVNISGGPSGVPGFRKLARTLKAYTRGACPTNRVILTPWHEMENTAESGFGMTKDSTGLADFRGAWHRMRTVFDAETVTNVVWAMCGSTGVTYWGNSMTDTGSTGFYPGHAYVDIVGWDPYNSAGQQDCTGAVGPRYNSTWLDFGRTLDRGDGSTGTNSSVLNRWGQMTWWFTNFAIDGATTAAAAAPGQGVYKPVWLFEVGTGEVAPTDPTNPLKQADVWFDRLATWATWAETPGAQVSPLRGIVYYNNNYNQVGCAGSHRRIGFSGRGTNTIWASISTG